MWICILAKSLLSLFSLLSFTNQYILVTAYVYTFKLNKLVQLQMTANALAESADECLTNGMDSFVSKPVTLQKLKECLEKYLR